MFNSSRLDDKNGAFEHNEAFNALHLLNGSSGNSRGWHQSKAGYDQRSTRCAKDQNSEYAELDPLIVYLETGSAFVTGSQTEVHSPITNT